MKTGLLSLSILSTALLVGTGCSSDDLKIERLPTGTASFALENDDYSVVGAFIGIFHVDDGIVETQNTSGAVSFTLAAEVDAYYPAFVTAEDDATPVDPNAAAGFLRLADGEAIPATENVIFDGFFEGVTEVDEDAPFTIVADAATAISVRFTVNDVPVNLDLPAPVGEANVSLDVNDEGCGGVSCGGGFVCASLEEADEECHETCDDDNPCGVDRICQEVTGGGDVTGVCVDDDT